MTKHTIEVDSDCEVDSVECELEVPILFEGKKYSTSAVNDLVYALSSTDITWGLALKWIDAVQKSLNKYGDKDSRHFEIVKDRVTEFWIPLIENLSDCFVDINSLIEHVDQNSEKYEPGTDTDHTWCGCLLLRTLYKKLFQYTLFYSPSIQTQWLELHEKNHWIETQDCDFMNDLIKSERGGLEYEVSEREDKYKRHQIDKFIRYVCKKKDIEYETVSWVSGSDEDACIEEGGGGIVLNEDSVSEDDSSDEEDEVINVDDDEGFCKEGSGGEDSDDSDSKESNENSQTGKKLFLTNGVKRTKLL